MACDRGRVFLGSHPGLPTVAGVRARPASVNSVLGAEPGIRQAAGSGSRSHSQEKKHAFDGEGVSPEGRLAPGRRGLQAFSACGDGGALPATARSVLCLQPPLDPATLPPLHPNTCTTGAFCLGGPGACDSKPPRPVR